MAAKKRKAMTTAAKAKSRSQAAKKGWETRKRIAAELEAKTKARSEAAKRGWETRKKKTLKKRIRQTRQKIEAVKPKKKRQGPKARKREQALIRVAALDELQAKIAELEKEKAELEVAFRNALDMRDLVPDAPLDRLKKDGTIALYPSRLRLIPEADELKERLERADQKSRANLDLEAYDISNEYDCPVKEVYTLFFSS